MNGDLEMRVRGLERTNRTMLAALGVAVLTIVAIGARQAVRDPEFGTITARTIVLKDGDGKTRVRIYADEEDNAVGFVVNAADGKPVVNLGAKGDGRSHLILRDERSKARINASITGGKMPYVQFTDNAGQELGVLP